MIGLDIIYPIASKVAYEIVINFHYLDTPILTAKGTLSIVGLWNNKDKSVSKNKNIHLRIYK